MKEAIAKNEQKQNKKNNDNGHFCCVCGEWFSNKRKDNKMFTFGIWLITTLIFSLPVLMIIDNFNKRKI